MKNESNHEARIRREGLLYLKQWLKDHVRTCDGEPNFGGSVTVEEVLGPDGYCGYELEHGVEIDDIIKKIEEILR